jgi:hypothetical protein
VTNGRTTAARAEVGAAELAPGAVGYVDADWINARGDGSPPKLVWREGVLHWRDQERVCEDDDDPDRVAGRALLALAECAVSRVGSIGAGRIEVVGTGFLAALVRTLLGSKSIPPGSGPEVVVDVTGDPDELVAATRRLEPMGSLMMMGESVRPLDIDLYPDVHVRGLRLVGLPPLLDVPFPVDTGPLYEVLARHPPAVVGQHDALAGAAWYRIEA